MFQVRKLSEQEKEAILYYGCFASDVIQPYFSNIDKEEIKSVLDIIRQKIIGITHYSAREKQLIRKWSIL